MISCVDGAMARSAYLSGVVSILGSCYSEALPRIDAELVELYFTGFIETLLVVQTCDTGYLFLYHTPLKFSVVMVRLAHKIGELLSITDATRMKC